ncbi:MAG: trehalose-phosphatase [Alphaproteobacteria bacterium]
MSLPPPLDPYNALFIDLDGTLLEIAPRPELVRVPEGLAELLARLAAQRGGALAVISGRRIDDFDRYLHPWRGAASGVHGAERRDDAGRTVASGDSAQDRQAAAALERLRPVLRKLGEQTPGILVEDKGRTLAVHYRQAPEREDEVRAAVANLLRQEAAALKVIDGKMVLELKPAHHDKGRAIAAFMAEAPFRGRVPVFVGDDTTDEDGFAEVNRRGGVSIRVGPPNAATAAVYSLPSVPAVLDWLRGDSPRRSA